jgi:hypothetical protein
MLKFLNNTNQPIKSYVFKVYLVGLLVGIPISFLLDFLYPHADFFVIELSLKWFMKAVIAAPIIETILMIPIIAVISKFTKNIIHVSLVSALTWSIIHSLGYPIHGLGVFPGFFLMSMAYQYWDVHSRGHALLVAMSIHALNNGTVLVLTAL